MSERKEGSEREREGERERWKERERGVYDRQSEISSRKDVLDNKRRMREA